MGLTFLFFFNYFDLREYIVFYFFKIFSGILEIQK